MTQTAAIATKRHLINNEGQFIQVTEECYRGCKNSFYEGDWCVYIKDVEVKIHCVHLEDQVWE